MLVTKLAWSAPALLEISAERILLPRGLVPLFVAPISRFGLDQLPTTGQFFGIAAIAYGVCRLIAERRLVPLRLLLPTLMTG
jgi:hypothetical protein